VAALKAEASCLVKKRKSIALGEAVRLPGGTILNLSGIGADLARLAAEALVEEGATALVSWGSAGGLHPALSPGSLILPETIISSDQTSFPVDAAWHKRLCTKLSGHVDLHTGALIQSPVVLRNPHEKAALFKECSAIGVDMESAAVVEVAFQAEIPFMAIRAVSDPADMTIPSSALAAVDEIGGVRPLRLIKSLARHPQEIFTLVRLGNSFRAARTTLRTVLLHAGHKLLAL